MTGPDDKKIERTVTYVNVLLPEDWRAGKNPELVDRILQALAANAETRASAQASGGRCYSVSELEGEAPPAGAILFNEAIGVLSIPSPPRGARAVATALEHVVPGLRIEEEVRYRPL